MIIPCSRMPFEALSKKLLFIFYQRTKSNLKMTRLVWFCKLYMYAYLFIFKKSFISYFSNHSDVKYRAAQNKPSLE